MPIIKAGPGGAPSLLAEIACGRNARAWLMLIAAVALHVFDEAVSGFLPFYNETVTALRARWGWFPMFTFPSFEVWLGALLLGICAGLALTLLVTRGGFAIRVFTGFVALVMISNTLGHLLGSVYFGRPIPGFWSSWVLLPVAVWMAYICLTGTWQKKPR